MSKIKRLEQLANENSLYRVSGVFDTSQICFIKKTHPGYEFSPVLRGEDSLAILDEQWLDACLIGGIVSIMCLQRG